MDINVKLDRNFTIQYNKLQEKYGEVFAKLNGFAERNLNMTDFIDSFIDANNVANASIDESANVGHKDIVALINEMPKPWLKLLSFNKIYYEINKKYGKIDADAWLEAEWLKALGMHDSHTSSMYSYSYKGTETIIVKYKGELLLTSFEDLYDIVEEPDTLLCEEDMAYCKYTKDLLVWDKDDTWTEVIRVIRKPKTKDFHWIKSSNGLSEIITSNHPVITTSGDKSACEIVPNEDKLITYKFDSSLFGNISELYCTDIFDDICFRGREVSSDTIENKEGLVCSSVSIKGRRGTNPIDNKIVIDYDFGWVIGFILAEGSFNHSVCISQKDNEYIEKLCDICDQRHWGYAIYPRSGTDLVTFQFQSNLLAEVFKQFIIGNTAWTKRLHPSFVNYNKDFLKGIVAGLIDGDGTCTQAQGRRIHLRITSRALVNQVSFIMRSFGYTVREQTPSLYNREDSYINSHLIYHMAFTPTMEDETFDCIKIQNTKAMLPYQREIVKASNKRYTFGYGEHVVLNNEVLSEGIQDDYVYDISVKTGHFICNNILSHNCFAYDLKDLAEKGLYFIESFNAEPPKHLETFVDFVKEHCSYTCNRSAGAVAYPNLIHYMYYFWKKDIDNNYLGMTKDNAEKFARQQIQRLIYAFNQPFLRSGIQSAFTNVNFFDHPYFEAIFGGMEFPDGTFAIDVEEEIIEFQKLFLTEMSEIRHTNMMTYPVSTISLLTTEEGEFVDQEFAKWACEHNRMWNDSNWFIDSSVTSLSSCCRLKNDIKELGNFNSIGGTALKVGSVKVSTINLARIAYQSESEGDYLNKLKETVLLDLKVLDCQRHIIERNIDKRLLPNFTYKLIEMKYLYSSIGILGNFETMKTFGYTYKDELGNTYYDDRAIAFGKKIFETIHAVKDEFLKDKDYHVNLEAVPGESMAARFQVADQLLYPDKVVKDLPLYGNQWIPLGIKTTMKERIRIASLFSSFCSGGDILHINVDAPFDSFEKAWTMLKYVAKQGVKYFAFTGKISACKHNHAFYGEKCPVCGEPVETYYSRIVGFFVPVKNYSDSRDAEWNMREWDDANLTALDIMKDGVV